MVATPLCVFDLDHTLVRSPLDLAAMRAEMRALAAVRGVPLPPAAAGWTVGDTIARLAAESPPLEAACWDIALVHERRALEAATGEPGAHEALVSLRTAGVGLAVWTNNTRETADLALGRCGLRGFFAMVVTRDEAPLKPDPGGLTLLRAAFPGSPIWVVGDSWVDGAAAEAGGVPFIAYGADTALLARHGVTPTHRIGDLRLLPALLAGHRSGHEGPAPV